MNVMAAAFCLLIERRLMAGACDSDYAYVRQDNAETERGTDK